MFLSKSSNNLNGINQFLRASKQRPINFEEEHVENMMRTVDDRQRIMGLTLKN